jgi:hypothetical protein
MLCRYGAEMALEITYLATLMEMSTPAPPIGESESLN